MDTDTGTDLVLAVDLGGTHMRAALVAPGGTLVEHQMVDTPRDDDCARALVALAAAVGGGQPGRAVIGVPGRVDHQLGRAEQAPNLPPGWLEALRADTLSDALGLPVDLANDADLAAVGEAYAGAGRGVDDVAYVTISTGIGAGVVLGGRLLRGRRSAGELGHTVIDRQAAVAGEPATVELLGSGTALGRLARSRGLSAAGAELLALVRAGDPVARAVWDETIAAAALGVANLAQLLVPGIVVLGGGVGRQGEVVLAPVRAALAAFGPQGLPEPVQVATAALGDDAALVGAASWAAATA